MAVPMVWKLLLGSMAVRVTLTPVAFVGFGFCMYMYSIHSVMLSSDIAGVPFAGMPKFVIPGD